MRKHDRSIAWLLCGFLLFTTVSCGKIPDDVAGRLGLGTNPATQTEINCELYVTDSDLKYLELFPQLQTLRLTLCEQVTDAGLAHLANLPQLQTLNLTGCRSITNEGLESLANLPQLQTLNLSDCENITDEGIARLANLTQSRVHIAW